MNRMLPVTTKEREVFMDVLRGLSILGIYIANLTYFSYYNEQETNGLLIFPDLDKGTAFLQIMLIEGKFYSIFSLLFGWGIALQMQRSKLDDKDTNRFLQRRLGFMLLLGGIHLVFIWIGDIVAFYAMLGFILLLFRKLSNKTLLITAAVFILLPIPLYYFKMKVPWLNAPAGAMFAASDYLQNHWNGITAQNPAAKVISETDNWLTVIRINMGDVFFRYGYLFFVSRIPKVLAMMMIGFVIGRSGIYRQLPQYKSKLKVFLLPVLLVALTANYFLAHYMENEGQYYGLQIEGWYATIAYAFGVAPLALTYATLLALLFEKHRVQQLMKLAAPIGKMAFTNYMLQSIIAIIVFYGPGFNLMFQFGPFALTLFAVVVFAAQTVLSCIWLKHFEYGPVEWLWRSLTYNKFQPMKKKASFSEGAPTLG